MSRRRRYEGWVRPEWAREELGEEEQDPNISLSQTLALISLSPFPNHLELLDEVPSLDPTTDIDMGDPTSGNEADEADAPVARQVAQEDFTEPQIEQENIPPPPAPRSKPKPASGSGGAEYGGMEIETIVLGNSPSRPTEVVDAAAGSSVRRSGRVGRVGRGVKIDAVRSGANDRGVVEPDEGVDPSEGGVGQEGEEDLRNMFGDTQIPSKRLPLPRPPTPSPVPASPLVALPDRKIKYKALLLHPAPTPAEVTPKAKKVQQGFVVGAGTFEVLASGGGRRVIGKVGKVVLAPGLVETPRAREVEGGRREVEKGGLRGGGSGGLGRVEGGGVKVVGSRGRGGLVLVESDVVTPFRKQALHHPSPHPSPSRFRSSPKKRTSKPRVKQPPSPTKGFATPKRDLERVRAGKGSPFAGGVFGGDDVLGVTPGGLGSRESGLEEMIPGVAGGEEVRNTAAGRNDQPNNDANQTSTKVPTPPKLPTIPTQLSTLPPDPLLPPRPSPEKRKSLPHASSPSPKKPRPATAPAGQGFPSLSMVEAGSLPPRSTLAMSARTPAGKSGTAGVGLKFRTPSSIVGRVVTIPRSEKRGLEMRDSERERRGEEVEEVDVDVGMEELAEGLSGFGDGAGGAGNEVRNESMRRSRLEMTGSGGQGAPSSLQPMEEDTPDEDPHDLIPPQEKHFTQATQPLPTVHRLPDPNSIHHLFQTQSDTQTPLRPKHGFQPTSISPAAKQLSSPFRTPTSKGPARIPESRRAKIHGRVMEKGVMGMKRVKSVVVADLVAAEDEEPGREGDEHGAEQKVVETEERVRKEKGSARKSLMSRRHTMVVPSAVKAVVGAEDGAGLGGTKMTPVTKHSVHGDVFSSSRTSVPRPQIRSHTMVYPPIPPAFASSRASRPFVNPFKTPNKPPRTSDSDTSPVQQDGTTPTQGKRLGLKRQNTMIAYEYRPHSQVVG